MQSQRIELHNNSPVELNHSALASSRDNNPVRINQALENTHVALQSESPFELIVSESALSFGKTLPNKPKYLLLRITQPNAAVPVTLESDAPALFQFATDSHPVFSPNLSFTPSSTSTYVHVRYAPTKPGTHRASLRIHATYQTESISIPLYGKSTWMSANLFRQRPTNLFSPGDQLAPQPAHSSWLIPVGVLALGVLAYEGYVHRCQLAPSLCTSENAPVSVALTEPTLAKPLRSERLETPTRSSEIRKKRTTPISTAEKEPKTIKASVVEPVTPPDQTQPIATLADSNSTSAANQDSQLIQKLVQPKKQLTQPDESDLERALNRKSGNN